MSLNLYRRHRPGCQGEHAPDSRSGEFEERKKSWKRCSCLIFASGTLKHKFKRQSTAQWEWDAAKTFITSLEANGDWGGIVPEPVQSLPENAPKGRMNISKATEMFLNELAETSAFATHKKYRLLMARLNRFSENLGYVMIDQWDPADVRQFRSTWPLSAPTAARRMSMMKPFFEYCLSNEWIARNPARLIKNPKTRDSSERRNEQKIPFSDQEIERMYEACARYGKTYKHKWTGEDLADFISLSVYTGLRISDVALFHIDRMLPSGEIRLRTTKAGTHVYTWVPEWLQRRIRDRVSVHGAHVFGEHKTASLDVITEVWRRKLNKLWESCGRWDTRPTPHRFRHTFARVLLQKPGVTVRDVAELLGNSEEIVLRHYSAWIPERQTRLTRVLQEAFEERPKPKVVAIR